MGELGNEWEGGDIEWVEYYELKGKKWSKNEERKFIEKRDIREKCEEYV